MARSLCWRGTGRPSCRLASTRSRRTTRRSPVCARRTNSCTTSNSNNSYPFQRYNVQPYPLQLAYSSHNSFSTVVRSRFAVMIWKLIFEITTANYPAKFYHLSGFLYNYYIHDYQVILRRKILFGEIFKLVLVELLVLLGF